MCTMTISKAVCKSRPVRIDHDRALHGLPDFVRKQCSTPKSTLAYFKSIGLRRSKKGELQVIPL